jgi:hypothetical protein
MATNLMIGYPQIAPDATTVTVQNAFATDAPKENVIYGPRTMHGALNAAAVSAWIKFDIGSAQAKTIDFLYVARAKIAKTMLSTRCLLDASSDDASYFNVAGRSADFQTLTLYGPRSEDAIFTTGLGNSTAAALPGTPTRRYWRFWIAGAADPSKKYAFSKVMFGAWFDFGFEPTTRHVTEIAGTWDRESRLVFKFGWQGVNKTLKDSLITNLIAKTELGCILHTTDYHDVLNEHRVLHCQIVNHEIRVRSEAVFDIDLTFEEMV